LNIQVRKNAPAAVGRKINHMRKKLPRAKNRRWPTSTA